MTEIFFLIYKNNLSWTAISSDLSLVFLLVLYFVFLLKFPLISRLEKSQFYLTACFTSLSLQSSKNCQFCHIFQICLQLGIRCWSSINTKWLDHSCLWHRFLFVTRFLHIEQDICNKIFGTRCGQTMSTIRCETESFATHRENKSVLSYTRWLKSTTESFTFHWHTGWFCVTKEHWYWYPRLLCFVACSWWLHTSCCVTYNLHPKRAQEKEVARFALT